MYNFTNIKIQTEDMHDFTKDGMYILYKKIFFQEYVHKMIPVYICHLHSDSKHIHTNSYIYILFR